MNTNETNWKELKDEYPTVGDEWQANDGAWHPVLEPKTSTARQFHPIKFRRPIAPTPAPATSDGNAPFFYLWCGADGMKPAPNGKWIQREVYEDATRRAEEAGRERDEALKFQQENYETILVLRAQLNEALSQLKTLGEELEEATVAHAIAENEAIDLRALAGAEKWQPIESAPRDGTEVLLWSPKYEICHAAWNQFAQGNRGGWLISDDTGDGYGAIEPNDATHWQPLPAPPAIGGENS